MATYSDSFTDTASTALESHTPDSGGGGAWSLLFGTAGGLYVNGSNQLAQAGNGTENQYRFPIAAGDVVSEVGATLKGASSDCPSLLLRATDHNNFIGLFSYYSQYRVYKKASGSFTAITSASTTTRAAGQVVALSVDGSDNFVATVNGSSILTVTDTFNDTEQNCGLLGRGDKGLLDPAWDDFTVTYTASGGGTTVNATVGSFTWGGLASPLSTQINAGVGGYTWQGKSSPLITTINATIGSYTFSGLSSSLSAQINASIGGYAWSGLSAPLSAQINAAIGTWTWSGKFSSVITTPSINATIGTWTWGGQFSPLASQLNAGVGGWTMQGIAATVTTPAVQLPPQLRFGSDREFAAASDRSFGVGSGANWKAKRYGLIN